MNDALKTPKIVFIPKQKMRDAANAVELSIDRSAVKASTGGGTATEPGEDETENPIGRPRNALNKWGAVKSIWMPGYKRRLMASGGTNE